MNRTFYIIHAHRASIEYRRHIFDNEKTARECFDTVLQYQDDRIYDMPIPIKIYQTHLRDLLKDDKSEYSINIKDYDLKDYLGYDAKTWQEAFEFYEKYDLWNVDNYVELVKYKFQELDFKTTKLIDAEIKSFEGKNPREEPFPYFEECDLSQFDEIVFEYYANCFNNDIKTQYQSCVVYKTREEAEKNLDILLKDYDEWGIHDETPFNKYMKYITRYN